MAKDLVCGMDVDAKTAAAQATYQGQTYYFCSPACKRTFEKQPGQYVNPHHEHGSQHHTSHEHSEHHD